MARGLSRREPVRQPVDDVEEEEGQRKELSRESIQLVRSLILDSDQSTVKVEAQLTNGARQRQHAALSTRRNLIRRRR